MIRDRSFYKTILRISLPSALQALISFLVVVADNIMVSRMPGGGATQAAAQAAVSQVNAITAFFTATILGFAGGSSVLIAQYWGRRDTGRIKRVFAIVMWINMLLTAAFVLLALLIPDRLTALVVRTGAPDVTAFARQYLAIICFSYIPYAVCYTLVAMLRAVEVVRMTVYTTFASLVVNVSLNYVLIFGHLGFPALGVRGAAIATVASRVVELSIVWYYAFHKQRVIDVRPRDLIKLDGELLRDYVHYGVPVGITDVQWALVGFFKAMIIGKLATEFMAANAITTDMMNLGTMFTFALAGGASVVVGKAVGAQEYDRAREYAKTIQIMFAVIGVVMALVVFLLSKSFAALYGSVSDPEVRRLALAMIAIGAITLVGTSYHASCFVGINRGAGDSRFVALVDMICGWLIVLPATYMAALVFHAPLPVVFLMTRIDQCFKWIIAFLRLRGNKWIKNVTRG